MLQLLFSVFDSKANMFLEVFTSATAAVAIRSFETAARKEGHQFNTYAADYTLFQVGSFNQGTAELIKEKTPINLGLAVSFLATPPALSSIAGGE